MYVCIEGNIGVGKSTIIEKLKQEGYNCLSEPIDEWRNTCGNILEKMYREPKKYTFAFQLNAILSIIQQNYNKLEIITERSIISAFHVFTKVSLEIGNITPTEYQILEKYFDYFFENINMPTAIIYLKLKPEQCMERIKHRKRPEEKELSLKYIKILHSYYKKLFEDDKYRLNIPIFVLWAHRPENELIENIVQLMNGLRAGIRLKHLTRKVDKNDERINLINYMKFHLNLEQGSNHQYKREFKEFISSAREGAILHTEEVVSEDED